MSEKRYRFSVELDGHETVFVQALNRVDATHIAAHHWGVEWRKSVTKMVIRELGRAPVKG